MSPRPYRLGRREAATAETRQRILAAAHDLIAHGGGPAGLTIDAIARRANVARMTVYYQFGSRAGLLEALFDSLAAHGGMEQLAAAFSRDDPREALAAYVETFAGFWAADRLVQRRLRALATLDAELEQQMQARNERRRAGLRVIVQRLAEQDGPPLGAPSDDLVDLLWMLTGFESYDALATADRTPAQVAALLRRLAEAAVEGWC